MERQNNLMPNYRRAWRASGTYFFTVNLLQRNERDLLVRHIDFLRDAIRTTKKAPPFNPVMHGLVGRVSDWPYSTFHSLVEDAVYPYDWAGDGGKN